MGDSGVWAMSDATSTLMRIDPARNAITARIHVSPGGDAAAGDGAVWLSHPQENSVSRIDAETNKVSATIRVPWASGVAVSPGAVWIADAGGPSVERIDPATNRVVARIRVGPKRDCCGERMGLTADGDAVWVANSVGRRVVRIDPRTNKVVDNIDLEHFMPCGFIVADRSTVWSAGATCTAAVARIDPRTRKVTAQLAEPHAVGMALAFGSLWVAVFDTGDIDRIDTRTGQVVARLHVGDGRCACPPASGRSGSTTTRGASCGFAPRTHGSAVDRGFSLGSPDFRAIPEETNGGRCFDRGPYKEPVSCAASPCSFRSQSSWYPPFPLEPERFATES